MTRRRSKPPSPVWWIAGGVFALAAIALRVVFGRDGQTVAADGTLHQVLWTIPLTFFFALCALASFSIGFVGWKAYRRR